MAEAAVSTNSDAVLAEVMQLISTGSYDQAEKTCQAALDTQPNNAGVLHALGLTHYLARRYGKAIEFMTKAVQFDDTNPQYFCNLGESLRRNRQSEQASAMFEKALALKPEYQLAHLGIGNSLRDQGRRPEAMARYRLALALDPSFAEAFHYLGVMYLEQDRKEEAIAYLRKAVSLKADYTEARMALAHALDSDGQIDEATGVYEHVLAHNPRMTAVHNNVANLLKSNGKIDEAIEHYERALNIDPGNVQAHYNLSRARVTDTENSDIEKMEQLLVEEGRPQEERSNIHFTLGKIYDDTKDFAKAFDHFKQGNDLDNRAPPFDTKIHNTLVDRIISVFDRRLFARREGFGSDSNVPIFIVGMPRSGTTLTEQTLASHPQVFGGGELDRISHLVNAISAEVSGSAAYPECARDLDAMTACRLGESYVSYLDRLSGKFAHVTDKMPANFMHLGYIKLFLPNAKIIHCRRNALDTCLSCYFQHFTNPMAFSNSLQGLGEYYRDYERIMRHWHSVMPGAIMDVDYEDMVENHEDVARRMVEHCGLEWDAACLQFYNRPVAKVGS